MGAVSIATLYSCLTFAALFHGSGETSSARVNIIARRAFSWRSAGLPTTCTSGETHAGVLDRRGNDAGYRFIGCDDGGRRFHVYKPA